jgi:DNA-binding NarL/FixJ family response regulator
MRLIVADDAVLFREGLCRLLTETGFEVQPPVADAAELLARVDADPPNVAIVDIRMPPTYTTERLEAARAIKATHPEVSVLVLSAHVEPHYAMHLLEDNASGAGYLLKERVAEVTELTDAVRRVGADGLVIDPGVVAQLVSHRRPTDPLRALSGRERDVLALMAQGRSNAAISERLIFSPKTVETYIRDIFTKLDLHEGIEDNRRVLAVSPTLAQRKTPTPRTGAATSLVTGDRQLRGSSVSRRDAERPNAVITLVYAGVSPSPWVL